MDLVWWLVGGMLVAGFAVSALITRLIRDPDERIHRATISELWRLARHLPEDRFLTDPATGQLISVERRLGLCWLVVIDPPPATNDDSATAAVATLYDLAAFGRPMPPPLTRRQQPLASDDNESPMTWTQARELLRFNDTTGALNATQADITDLLAQLYRTLAEQR